MGEVAMRREHMTRKIRCHREAWKQLYEDEDISLLRMGIASLDGEWEFKTGREEDRRRLALLNSRVGGDCKRESIRGGQSGQIRMPNRDGATYR